MASAFEFTPSVMIYSPDGRGSTQKYDIYNSSPTSIPIEISAVQREMTDDGKEIYKPTKDFNVYPRLFDLKPGESRTVKVTYVGDKKITQEHAYRIIAEQLKVDLGKKQNKKEEPSVKIDFLYKYETSAYVSPPNTKAKVEISSFNVILNEKKEKMIEVVFNNKGTAHQVFQDWTLEIFPEGASAPISLDKKLIKNFPEFNILSGSRLKISVPWPANLKSNPRSVSYKVPSE